MAEGDSGAYFYEVTQPIYFAAADSIDSDTTQTVLLRVWLIEEDKLKNEYSQANIKNNECFTGTFLSESRKDVNFNLYEPIIIAWDQVTHQISTQPEMPTLLTIWLQPVQYVGEYQIDWELEVKWTSKAQVPDKIFSYTFSNSKTNDDPDGTDLPLPNTDPTIVGGDSLTLKGVYYDSKYPNGYHLRKKITSMKILGTNAEDNVQVVNNYINTQEFPEIDLPLSEPVSLDDQRKQMRIIVEKASSHFQFLDTRYEFKPHGPNDIGYPNNGKNAGGPADWGLCQLNEWEPSLGVIWNWKENINAGIDFLWEEKYGILKSLYNKIKKKNAKKGITVRGLKKEEFLLWHTQLYRRGSYYVEYSEGNPRKNEPSKFVKTNIKKYYEYGDDFLSRYEQ